MSNLPSESPSDPNDDTRSGDDVVPIEVAAEPTQRVVPTVVPKDEASRLLAELRERVYSTMLKRHTIDSQMAWGLIGGGVAILFLAGVVFSFVMMIVSGILFGGPGFSAWLLLYVIALVPLMIWQERRTRGGFFTFAQPDVDLTRDRDNMGEYLLERSKANANAVVEGFLWAPRAIFAGIRALRGIREPGLDLVLPEAADLLTLLLSLDGGVKIKDLAPPGEDPMQLMPTLKWLDAHDYIGISTRGDRVWVSTFAKKRLKADHGDAINIKPAPARPPAT